MTSSMARAVAGLLLAVASAVAGAAPASAGGALLHPVQDRYEPGEVATLVGYVSRGTQGWLDDGPFYGYLHDVTTAPVPPSPVGRPLGRLAIEDASSSGWAAVRVSINVRIPLDLAPGHYQVGYCNDPCTGGFGDLRGGRPLNVAVDPVERAPRSWPLDEPMIEFLPADALVSGPGYLAPASEIWAGRVLPNVVVPQVVVPLLPSSPAPMPAPSAAVVTPVEPRPAIPVAVPPVVPASVVQTPPFPAPAPATPRSGGGSPVAVLLGVGLVVACTGGVLCAMRQDVPVPAKPVAV